MSSFSFQRFPFDLEDLKESEGYRSIDSIDLESTGDAGWAKVIIKQLVSRDKIINILNKYIEDFLEHGRAVELDLKHFKCKTEDCSAKIKELKQLLKKEKKTSKKLKKKNNKLDQCDKENKNTQTESTNEWDWYNYYSQHQTYDYYNSGNQNYTNNQTQSSNNNEDKLNNIYNTEKEGVSDEEPKNKEDSRLECKSGVLDLSFQDVSSAETSIKGTSPESKTELNNTFEQMQLRTKEENKLGTEEKCGGWDASNIKEEVQNLAEEITNQLGYVFMEEIGMYYDHTSGYYYDHKTSLYYDGKTGTYFYYDHEANKYQFYAQVTPTQDVTTEGVLDAKVKKRKATKETVEKEEGECSESGEEDSDADNPESTNEAPDMGFTRPPDIAPSLRLMVMNGALKGNLHVITRDGGIIGREGDIDVVLKNVSVSKVHAQVSYRSEGPNDHHYYVKDLGSSNGTLVKGKRLSEPKTQSDTVEIGHGWELQCGDVLLSCHVHPGLLTCNTCEPGLIEGIGAAKVPSVTKSSKGKLERERRRQNKALRKKFSLGCFQEQPSPNANYKDRAGLRRDVVGSDNPYEKTQSASVLSNITKENKGFQILQKMGWSEGDTLGANDRGIAEPIVPKFSNNRTGLGASNDADQPLPNQASNPKKNVYQKMLSVTKERYEKTLSPTSPSSQSHTTIENPSPPLFKPIKFNLASNLANGS